MISKKNLPHWITVVSFVVFVALGLACATVEPQFRNMDYRGEDSKVLEGSAYAYLSSDSIDGPFLVTFLANGKLNGFFSASWERTGSNVKMVINDGASLFEGIHDPETNTITGIITRSTGIKADVTMTFVGEAGITLYSASSDFHISGDSERLNRMLRLGTRMVYFTNITDYTGSDTAIRIPPIIDNLLVTGIAAWAFENKGLTKVTIPGLVNAGRNNNIKHQVGIGLGSVTPDADGFAGINTIGKGAFSGNRLASVVFPDNIRSIEAEAFANNQLTSVTFGKELVSIGEGAFVNNQLTSIVIPSSVREIGSNAFTGNPLVEITIGPNVTLTGSELMPFNFKGAYLENSLRAGTYRFVNEAWTVELR